MSEEFARTITERLFDLSMALDRLGNATAARIGINQTDLICLTLLSRRGPMSPSQIAAELGLTTAAISAMATRLEAGGYIRREMDPADRRRILMHSSPAGTRKAHSLFDGFYEAVVGLSAGRGRQDLNRLADLLERFQQVLDEQTGRLS